MPHTNINIDAIEQALSLASLKRRVNLIDEAVKIINIWLTPDPKKTEVVNIIAYKGYDVEHKFSLDVVEQRQLIEKMFDDNMSIVFIEKISEVVTKGFFSKPQYSLAKTETRNYLFTTLAIDLKTEADLIKGTLSALRNPRVLLTLEEHRNLVYWLKRFNINLSDYYI